MVLQSAHVSLFRRSYKKFEVFAHAAVAAVRTLSGYTTVMEELPEETIEVAEHISVDHCHDGLGDDNDRLLAHLRSDHDLAAPVHLSSATLDGLHDRLHHETGAGNQ